MRQSINKLFIQYWNETDLDWNFSETKIEEYLKLELYGFLKKDELSEDALFKMNYLNLNFRISNI